MASIEGDTQLSELKSKAEKDKDKEKKHNILCVDTCKLNDLMAYINFRMNDYWVNIKYIVDLMMKQEDGKYAFVKLPFK